MKIKYMLPLFLIVSNLTIASTYIKADFLAFCYHDVSKLAHGKLYKESTTLHTEYLINHFQWLKHNGYTVISSKMVADAKLGKIILPKKSVMLTFDDGYNSFYTVIFPLLKQFNYPATFAIVTNWIGNSDETVMFGNQEKKKADFMTWSQIKEISESGLIEIASHSHNLHKGIQANPQGNTQSAATSRIYNKDYESDTSYQERIYSDLNMSKNLILKHTGIAPTTLVWPYGSYSLEAWKIAKSLGFKTSMTLGEGVNHVNNNSENEHIGRFLIDENPSMVEFKSFFTKPTFKMPQRVVHVDLDYVYDDNPVQLNKNLDTLLERIKKYNISTVYLQAFADNNGDGNAEALYFPNNHLPMKADLFNRVAWQLRTRAFVKVYAWMPVSSFKLSGKLNTELGVFSWQNGETKLSINNYQRLSIFKPKAKSIIKSIYASLAKHTKFAGILYHDDGLLTDFEDLNPDALEYYKNSGLKFNSVHELVTTKNISQQWSKIKTKALIDFIDELTQQIKVYQPEIKTARNIYSQIILNPQSETWFAQNFRSFVEHYDTTAIMAMPYMENSENPIQWISQLADMVNEYQLPKDKILFELQSKNWNTRENIKTSILVTQMEILQQKGFTNFGYYPDDFLRNHPNLNEMFPVLSLSSYPFEKK